MDNVRLTQFRDTTDQSVTQWPKALRPSATVIVVDDLQVYPWKVLVHQRADNGYFGFPGGACEIGESLPQAALRECLEETGLHARLERLSSIDSDPLRGALVAYPDGNVIQYVNCSFVCSVLSGTLRKSEESLQLFWSDIRRLPEPFMQIHRWRLAQAISNDQNVPVL